MHMNSHTHSVQRLEIIETGRRRRWSDDEKRRIVTESLLAPRLGSATARRYGISSSQLFAWKRAFGVCLEDGAANRAQMIPVLVAPEQTISEPPAQIEIVLPRGVRILVTAAIDPAALARIIAALDP
jgi:transposase